MKRRDLAATWIADASGVAPHAPATPSSRQGATRLPGKGVCRPSALPEVLPRPMSGFRHFHLSIVNNASDAAQMLKTKRRPKAAPSFVP